ncbi:hypothetical protein, partial [Mycobacterium sp. 852013-50091_SCH5140682]|uniref:hypothetical protein n=1 Tax=Mycobacterium sp. 852013-50091_SCH5140682 TaxID=1834109 RepID=UPI001E53EFCB
LLIDVGEKHEVPRNIKKKYPVGRGWELSDGIGENGVCNAIGTSDVPSTYFCLLRAKVSEVTLGPCPRSAR